MLAQQQINLTTSTEDDVQGFGSASGAAPPIIRRQSLELTLLGVQSPVISQLSAKLGGVGDGVSGQPGLHALVPNG